MYLLNDLLYFCVLLYVFIDLFACITCTSKDFIFFHFFFKGISKKTDIPKRPGAPLDADGGLDFFGLA